MLLLFPGKHLPKLLVNRIDFFYGLELSTVYGFKKAGLDPEKVEKSLLLSGGLQYYYGVNIDTSDEIVDQFNRALQKIKDNGVFDRIANKYMSN